MEYSKLGLFNTPARIIIAVGVVVFSVELLFMALLHGVLVPIMPFEVPDNVWNFVDAFTLVVFTSPVLYFLVFKRMQQDIQDIGELNALVLTKMQHEIIELTRLTTNFADAVCVGLLLVDKDLRVHRWNQWMEHKTGIPSQQACGKLLTELFANFHSPRMVSAIELCIDHKSPQLISQALNHYVLPIPVPFAAYDIELMRQQVSVVPLTDGNDKTLAVISINDVTETAVKSSALIQLARKMEALGTMDQLTGAYNRHFLWTWLIPELKQCARYGQSLGCLMLDIDHFKRINDTHGHDVGDAVLRGFSSILKEQLRDSDILVRFGGEEFVVLLTHADISVALEIADRILNAMRQAVIAPLEAGGVRCSIGVSIWTPDNSRSAEELLKEADGCLYQAKYNGRDQVAVIYEHPA